MHIGFSLDETLDMPFGELKTYIAIQQIKVEGAKEQGAAEEEFFDLVETLR